MARRKALLGALATAVIVALAIPFFSMRMGHADQGNDPAGTTTRKGYDLIAQGFGVGYNSTLTLVVSGPQVQQTAEQVAAAVKNVPNVDPSSVFVPPKPLTDRITVVSIKSITSPQDAKTTQLVKTLRSNVLPSVYRGTPDHVYVYGQTAVYTDFTHVLSSKMPLFIGAVVLLSFLLLMIAFRSLLIPLTAAIMNLFAAAASFGFIVAIFQWGWGSEMLGIGQGGPIEAFAPVLFFAILFGLSMDYQVFLVSRMHEEWVHSHDNRRAITVGQRETGGIITAAALIMIAVFGGFVLGDNRVVKLIGLGLASAIFIDAFILRTVLVPSVMHLLGRWNWYYPSWLSRITPRVSVEPPDDQLAARARSRANATRNWPRFRAKPYPAGQAMAAKDPATVSWASSGIDRLITAKATGPSSWCCTAVPRNPTDRPPCSTDVPTSGNTSDSPAKCTSTSRRGGRPRFCTRATVSWPR